jgi:hypothetical protein
LAFARCVYQIENPSYVLEDLKVDIERALTKSSTYFCTLDNHSMKGVFAAELERPIGVLILFPES